nr:MAG: replication initiator protein [Microvirus sp.]
MACFDPRVAVCRPGPPGAKQSVTVVKGRYVDVSSSYIARGVKVVPIPCGQCVGCRLERSRQWAIRLMKELKLHDRSSFLTLTYSDEFLPRLPSGRPTLVLEDVQLFLKRLRFDFSPARLRFFQCGEYGDATSRPHHHMILFGEDFCKDRVPGRKSRSGFPQWTSPTLTRIWGKGDCFISDVSFESAAYVARYCLKKQTGSGSKFFYQGRKPEFITMSRNPGIASAFFEEFRSDIYPHDEVIPGIGRPPSLPPKYFDKLLEKVDPVLFDSVKKKRVEGLDFFSDPESTDSRLATRARLKASIIKNCLKRSL